MQLFSYHLCFLELHPVLSNFDKLEENQASYWGLRGVGWGEGRDRQAGPKTVLRGSDS